MTFRRVMLVLLPLLGVGFVFAVMWYLYRDWERSLVGRHQPEVHNGGKMPTGVVEMETAGHVAHEVSTDVNLIRKDRHGRTEVRFLADRIEHFEKKTADIERPRIQFFTKQGEVITILAERGHVRTKGALMDVDDIESGRLWGNVVLVHDRGSPGEYADDILVGLDDVTFDNDAYEIATDGPVLMAGGEMTLSASKMRMALDPETRRLHAMTFLEDILITFEAGDSLRVSLTAPARPAGEREPPLAEPPTPAPPQEDAEADGAEADGAEASADGDQAGDLWRIDLAGDVHAQQEAQRLRCDRLTLYNRSRGAAAPDADRPAAPVSAGEAADATAEAPAPPSAPAADEAPQAPRSLMTVVADGPLIITPVDEAERLTLGDEQYQVSATGGPAVVEDGDTRITGHTVRYNTRTGSGSVIGEASPMRLEQPGQIMLTGRRLDFDRAAATAEVTGEGRLVAHVQTAGLTGITASPEGLGPDASAADADRLDASWHKGLRLVFYRLPEDASQGLGEIREARFRGRAIVRQGDGLLKGDDLTIDFYPAEGDRGQAVRQLVGHGDVLLKNAPVGGTGADDAAQVGDIESENLDIRFARDSGGGARPTQLDASGDVAINDPKGKIRAQELAVTFAVSDEGDTEAQFLEARGDVLIDREDLHAEGDHVRRDTAEGTL
ncbi:MAG: LPS export ABC transporter periplasmic protein LptC, partial [Planctomycetota bacterium]|nr:LPS export ABC transporter periplasmic protein LptC [Planctomycetota bacterium]